MSTVPVHEHAVKLVALLVKSYVANGNYDLARALVAELRFACDELSAEINEAARRK